ncbi:hypothetical protein [Myroides marinus]|uniref:hypothetical protein n=1 Tax=Myroides marinus TaxID=703342 RepID=UPI00257599A7|nr:hypothetical protein [Myroides marinus]MDM1377729.1 hypothetical protein [Myroides marinus]MDM1385067.1 hypothetical protein [Myroides marinus]MDM1392213.1 hypothetical protein [Myroides marinus]
MKITIFYSWQSDTKHEYNKDFIWSAIKEATILIKNENIFPDIEFDLQQATENIAGRPDIPKELLLRIRKCDIFIGDLSVINYPPSIIRKIYKLFRYKHKGVCNNNVVHELTVAQEKIGIKRTIAILNSVYGSPHKTPEIIPFDIRHQRFPIEYELNKKENITLEQKIIINSLKKEIVKCIEETLTDQDNKYRPFKRWKMWHDESHYLQTFKTNQYIESIILQIKDSITKNLNSIRILGLSGLGKSRLLLELLKPDTSIESKLLSYRVLYYDFSEDRTLDLTSFVAELQEEKEDKILILDNCDPEKHQVLLNYLKKKDNKLFLITVDSNPEELSKNKVEGINYIKIEQDKLESIVNEIITEEIANIKEKDSALEKIKKFAENNPLMATLICKNWNKSNIEFKDINDKTLLKKLLGAKGDETERENRAILRACSLFSSFGYLEEFKDQLKFIATNRDITSSSITNDTVLIDRFNEVCLHYLERGIFEKRGRKLQMRPLPLALHLAYEWLSNCDTDKILNIINSINQIESDIHRKDINDSLAKQMRYFGTQKKAIEIVGHLTAKNGAFHNAEVLNTELGSRLFRSFVEVNPASTSLALWQIFSKMKREELLLINEGRRNIIYSLNKLCFNRSTFEISTKVLFIFALAENEHWANNSIGELRSLFKIFLPGTQANLEERFKVLEWAYKKDDFFSKELVLKCMDSALSSSHFSRFLGAEEHGLITLKEYAPATEEEITDYWKKILNLIIEPIYTNESLDKIRIKVILDSIISFIKYGEAKFIFSKLEIIFEQKEWNCIEGLDSLIHIKKYNYDFLYDDCLKRVDTFVERLSEDNFNFKFVHGLKLSEYKKTDGEFHSSFTSYEESISFYKNLGKEFIEKKISWDESLPIIFSSDPLYTNSFGSEISSLINEDSILPFITQALEVLNSLPRDKRNYSLLEGFTTNLSSRNKEILYTNILKYQDLEDLYIYLIACDKEGYKYFSKLIDLIKTRPEHVVTLSRFSYSNAFVNSSSELLISFFNELVKLDNKFIPFISEVLFSILKNEIKNDEHIKSYTKTFILEYGENFNLSDYRIGMFMIEFLNREKSIEIAKKYNSIIINRITLENVFRLENTAQQIYRILLTEYFEYIWPELSNSLIGVGKYYVKFYALKSILGAKIGGVRSSSIGLLFDNNNIDQIFEWAKENKEIAPARLAELIPIYDGQNDIYNKLNPIAERLLSLYGESEKVISGFSSNMGSFVWSGSIIPLLEGKMEIFSILSNHKSDNVRNWALNKLNLTKKEIQYEKDRDEEIYL